MFYTPLRYFIWPGLHFSPFHAVPLHGYRARFSMQEFDECVKLIDDILAETNGVAEYPVYVKALTRRMQGTA